MSKPNRQAVLLIHGMGEQRPMDTLRRFIRAVWETDDEVKHKFATPETYNKPDTISKSFELRKITTTKNQDERYTDFFEYYWAHRMQGTTFTQVITWFKRLMLRPLNKVPEKLRLFWFVLWGLVTAVGLFTILTLLQNPVVTNPWFRGLSAIFSVFAAWIIIPNVNNILGDAARYLDDSPSNIASREEIRQKGVEVLKELHDSEKYNRIILVGHSLGSVIGYDILTYAWPNYNSDLDRSIKNPKLNEIEAYLNQKEFSVGAYQKLQKELRSELVARKNPWLVTDFVTMGSPLTHAKLFLADNEVDFHRRTKERELPTCPPQLEQKGPGPEEDPTIEKPKFFSYPLEEDQERTLHHAAMFGPVRWTNLYFPVKAVIKGDFIGGPLADVLGKGILDKAVSIDILGGFFSHTRYWFLPKKDKLSDEEKNATHIVALREAVNLMDD